MLQPTDKRARLIIDRRKIYRHNTSRQQWNKKSHSPSSANSLFPIATVQIKTMDSTHWFVCFIWIFYSRQMIQMKFIFQNLNKLDFCSYYYYYCCYFFNDRNRLIYEVFLFTAKTNKYNVPTCCKEATSIERVGFYTFLILEK